MLLHSPVLPSCFPPQKRHPLHALPSSATPRRPLAANAHSRLSTTSLPQLGRARNARPHTLLRAASGPSWSNPAEVIKREQSLQSNRLKSDVRDRVEAAVESLGFRVTAGDVAARAGVQVFEADEALQALAFDTEGALEVSAEGDVVYVLPSNFRQTLRTRSVVLAARPVLQKVQAAAGWLVRAAFGTALVSSIFIVWIAIVAILSSSRDRDRNRGGGGYSPMGYPGGGVNVFFNVSDLFWYFDPRLSPYDRYQRREEGKMSLLSAIFSFVFGDGDPNIGFEEQRWRALGSFIQARGGVVTAEEMAPFLDPPELTMDQLQASRTSPAFEDESFVLPALLRFGGEPVVDEATGSLLYKFPSLQKTAQENQRWGLQREEGLVQEEEWKLTRAAGEQVAITAGLGGFNVLGVGLLSSMLTDPGSRYVLFAQGLGWIAKALPALQLYAFAFFAIPALRWFVIQRRNTKIEERNEARITAARLLNAHKNSDWLGKKLASARREGERLTLSQDSMIFSSAKDASKQVNDLEAAEFDRKLGVPRQGSYSDQIRQPEPQARRAQMVEDRWGEL